MSSEWSDLSLLFRQTIDNSIKIACYVETMLELNKPIPEPVQPLDYKGNFVVRIEPVVHYKLDQQAKILGKSLNKVVTDAFNFYLDAKCTG